MHGWAILLEETSCAYRSGCSCRGWTFSTCNQIRGYQGTYGNICRGQEFAQKAKDKKLQPSDWEGNTFTISNLGMFGIDTFTAIVNPPDSCILAVGGIKEKAVVKNGNLQPGHVMKVTLSCDHRVVDGATGAAFLQTFKSALENPFSMLL